MNDLRDLKDLTIHDVTSLQGGPHVRKREGERERERENEREIEREREDLPAAPRPPRPGRDWPFLLV